MKIGLIGYGKMGKAIEEIAIQRGHEVVFRANSQNPLSSIDFNDAEVAIEFTQPGLAIEHIRFCAAHQLPVVVGTTAWSQHLPEVEKMVGQENGSLLYASNFSIGVNIFFRLNEELARMMAAYPEYAPSLTEIHHTQKLDAPSGTAVTLANDLIHANPNFGDWVSGLNEQPEADYNQLPITALREPEVPGTHTVTWNSEADQQGFFH